MIPLILDGKKLADTILSDIHAKLLSGYPRKPKLAAILTTKNPASLTYVSKKVDACNKIGFLSVVHEIEADSEQAIIRLIKKLNDDKSVDGILVQLPLPAGIRPIEILAAIDPSKDVDGFHPINMGKVLIGDESSFYPCTPRGIHILLQHYEIATAGKHMVIVGRSNIVGKPLAAIMMQNKLGCNATVTVAHSHTHNLERLCLSADILVAAVGHEKTITENMVKKGAVVIDVGMNRIPGTKRVTGDVDFENVAPKCSAITPVPGGIGPMTIAMLLENTFTSFLSRVS